MRHKKITKCNRKTTGLATDHNLSALFPNTQSATVSILVTYHLFAFILLSTNVLPCFSPSWIKRLIISGERSGALS
jgi:hypothetical protein